MIPTRQQVEQLRAAASALRHTPPEMEREVERDEDTDGGEDG